MELGFPTSGRATLGESKRKNMSSKRRPDWKTRDKRKDKDKAISVARKRTYVYKQVYIIYRFELRNI